MDVNWHMLYIPMYLNMPNDVTSAALPSRIKVGTHDMSSVFDVNGDAMEASASDIEIPACAVFKACNGSEKCTVNLLSSSCQLPPRLNGFSTCNGFNLSTVHFGE